MAQPSDSNALRIGILSTAKIARNRLIPAILGSRNATVVAIASRDADRARDLARENGIPRWCGSYEALLNDPEVEAVYNPLPNSLHRSWSIAAAEAGKHVLCEKPLAGTAEDAEAIVDACAKRNVKLMEGFMYRFHPRSEALHIALADHAIGQIRYIRSAFTFHLADPASTRFSQALEGGASRDVGCYCIDLARWVTGEEPISVFADAQVGDDSGVDEVMHATLRFPWGIVSQHISGFHVNMPADAEIVGTEGRIRVPEFPRGESYFEIIRGDEAHRVETATPNQYQLMVEYFADAIRNDRPIERCGGRNAVANMRVIDALFESARTGRAISVLTVK
ncbi:MAG: Gfo/Idh/MocA family oxidoreductase [Phycisphaerae bacterium]|nr:Gfo/Idh/MocA family oxidoreductase [Phycisphaerae bacterium]